MKQTRPHRGLPKGGAGGGSPVTDEERASRKATFLAALAEGYSPTEAGRRAGISHQTPHNWRKLDPDFAEAWDSALEEGTDLLEDEMHRRALAGSDTLLIFALKARRRAKYGDLHSVRHVGHDGGAVKIEKVEDTRPSLDEVFPVMGAE